jgi:membrane fusion protein
MTNPSLFRAEVLQQRAGQWLGGVRLAQSVPVWIVTTLALMFAAALIIFLVVGTYAKKSRVVGVLMPQGGEINITAPELGRVVELRVKEGDLIKAGEVLFVLATDRQSNSGDTSALLAGQIEARRVSAQAELSLRKNQTQTRLRSLADRAKAMTAEIQKAESEVDLQSQRRELYAQSVARYQRLSKEGFFSSAQVQQQQGLLLEQEAKLQGLERNKLALERDRQSSLAESRELESQLATDLARMERDIIGISQESTQNEARRSAVLVASQSGVVTALGVGVGQTVQAGQNLATLMIKDAKLEAHLYASSKASGFIAAGQSVLLRYAAYPYQKFGLQHGTVNSLSQSTFAPQELPRTIQPIFAGKPNPEALYRVTVTLDRQSLDINGRVQPLKPGMTVEADIVQDRRRIVEWMFEPLIALARRS